MLVAVTGLGSVWRRRIASDHDDQDHRRFARAVYYNTTGVLVNDILRTRPRIVGHVRFNSVSGLDPNYPSRILNRVFECSEPCIWKGQNKLLFQRLVPTPCQPEMYLAVLRPEQVGPVRVGTQGWRSDDNWVISFSEDGERQETMLLMPANSWVRGELGSFFLEPDVKSPWRASLRLRRVM